MKKWTAVSLAGLLLLFIVLQAHYLNLPFERDEGNYAYGAWIMTKGLAPYLNTFEQKPPLIYLPYLAALLINPRACWPVHLLAALSLLGTVLLIGLVARREFNQRTGLLAMWLLVPLTLLPQLTPFAANAEKFMILPFAGLLAIHAFYREKAGGQAWFWAGVCGMATLLYKQIAVLGVLYVFAVWLYQDWRRQRAILRQAALALAGALSTFVLVCGYFIYRAGALVFWQQTVVYNRYYAATFGGLAANNFLGIMRIFSLVWPVLLFLLAWGLVRGGRRALFYLGLLAVFVASIFVTPYGHYYIMVMPVAALVLAASFDSLLGQLDGRVYFALAVLLIGLLLWPVRNEYWLKPNEFMVRSYGLNPFIEAPLAAEHVAALSAPDDYVYVAGTEPEIFYYAKRLCPARIIGAYGLMLPNEVGYGFQKETIWELEERQPKVIVWVRANLSWMVSPGSPRLILDYFDWILTKRYRLVGGTVRQGNDVFWQEPLRDEGNCILKVYQLRPEPTK